MTNKHLYNLICSSFNSQVSQIKSGRYIEMNDESDTEEDDYANNQLSLIDGDNFPMSVKVVVYSKKHRNYPIEYEIDGIQTHVFDENGNPDIFMFTDGMLCYVVFKTYILQLISDLRNIKVIKASKRTLYTISEKALAGLVHNNQAALMVIDPRLDKREG